MLEFNIVGQRLPRIDGPVKVTGQALYAGDIVLPRTLQGRILRSPLPHARILHIDTSRAARLSGVRAVVTGADTLGRTFGPLRFKARFMDEYPLVMDKVRYVGDPVAAVAAIDEDTAEEAVRLIDVAFEELPAVFSPEEALREGAPLIHEVSPGNVSREVSFDFGDLDRRLAESYLVRSDRFSTQAAQHVPLEPHTAVAHFDPSGKLTLWTSTQGASWVKSDLALAFDLPSSQIRVIMPYVGGGFGGKAEGMYAVDFCAALLSRKSGQPVRIMYTREEEFIAGRRRHPLTVDMTTGLARDGEILARQAKVILDGGAYHGFGPATVLLCGIFLNLPYRYRSFRFQGVRAYTNNPVSAAMRGHGSPQVHFASEMQLDRMARELGMDPFDLRLRNALRTGDVTLNGFKIFSSGFADCLEAVRERSGWREKYGQLPPNKGIGLGCGGFPAGTGYRQRPEIPTYSAAMIRINEDGTVVVLSGAADTGQGSDSLLVQIAAEELGLDPADVAYVRADTELTPADMGNFSSRETVFAGNAVRNAAIELKQVLLAEAAEKLEANPDDLEMRDGRIQVRGSAERALAFKDVAFAAQMARLGKPLVGQGTYDPPDKINYATYTFGAQVAEVEVDPETGQVNVVKMTGAHDCGRAINPMAIEGQLEGSIHMTLGWVFTEDHQLRDGRVLNPNLLEYKIPTALEMPSVEVAHVESIDPQGPYGAKEAGEGIVSPTAPAIVNAIQNALGVEVDSLPVDMEKLTAALRSPGGNPRTRQ